MAMRRTTLDQQICWVVPELIPVPIRSGGLRDGTRS
jgi:hypothetical protein